MDHHPVPFPTLSHAEEAQNPDAPPTSSSRVHSSPSLPNLWPHTSPLPAHLANHLHARYRPRLRPLDLAAAPDTPRLPVSSKHSAPGSPARPAPLTPPLTPASSFHSAAHDAPGHADPPDPPSPLRWLHAAAERAYPSAGPDPACSPATRKGTAAEAASTHAGYLTPSSGRSQSISSDADSGYATVAGVGVDVVAALAAGMSGVDITPRDERPAALGVPDAGASPSADSSAVFDAALDENTPASRFLLVRNVPPAASSAKLRDAFAPTGDIKGIHVRFQASGLVILAYYNVRHAARARRQISGHSFACLDDVRLEAGFITLERLEMITGKSPFIAETDGALLLSIEGRPLQPADVQNVLLSFGELMSFGDVPSDSHDQRYHVEYFDVRDAANAFRALNKRTFLGARLRFFAKKDAQADYQAAAPSPDDPFQMTPSSGSGPYRMPASPTESLQADRERRFSEGRIRPRSVSLSESVGTPDAVRKLWRGRESPHEHGRRCSNDLFFDAIGKVPVPPETPSRPRSISIGTHDMPGTARPQRTGPYAAAPSAYPYPDHSYPYAYADSTTPHYSAHHAYPQSYLADPNMYAPPDGDGVANNHWAFAPPSAPAIEYYLPPSPNRATFHHPQVVPATPRKPLHSAHQRQNLRQDDRDEFCPYIPVSAAPSPRSYRISHGAASDSPPAGEARLHAGTKASGQAVIEKNQLNVALIEEGKDMRTTVMIKNIPNKMSDKDLLAFIGKVCPRRIDFLYLRMDFQNGACG
ncbi:hypothetical protein AcV7_004213 [Taiwanofungus camphoratus]|nr:hypothetical protein AcV7_004213 [Antrodia cinnamomea]